MWWLTRVIKKISTDGCTLCLAREEENDVPIPKGDLGSRILEAQKSGVKLLVTIQSVMGEEAAVDEESEGRVFEGSNQTVRETSGC